MTNREVISDQYVIPNLRKISLNCTFLEIIRSKGLEKINLDDLVNEMLPKGRELVPS